MLEQEARTQTVRAWTGLTSDRVRNLARGHVAPTARGQPQRHRGPSPSCLAALLSTARMHSEASAAAGLCRVMQILPERPLSNARAALPSPARAERLLDAFELFRTAIPQARLTLEQLVLLVLTVAEGDSWALDHCTRCHATILIDQLDRAPRRLCAHCKSSEENGGDELVVSIPQTGAVEPHGGGLQQRLFD
jgi:hypothetical protein